MENIQRIYNALQDEESKYIFQQRLLFSLGGEEEHITDMVDTLLSPDRFGTLSLAPWIEKYHKAPKKTLLFGAGPACPQIARILRKQGIPISGICDNYAKSAPVECADIPLIKMADIREMAGSAYIVITPLFPENYKPMHKQIIDIGFPQEDISIASMHSNTYFDKGFMKPQPNEVFIDAGVYMGDTIEGFLLFCKDSYSEIYGFDPNQDVLEQMTKNLEQLDLHDTEIFQRGAWNSETTLSFDTTAHPLGASIQDHGSTTIRTKTIDSIKTKNPVTLIKMDIEGAELKALEGGKETIKRDRPRLAICVYHKPEDMLTIPEYILSLHPDYKLRLRHYTYGKGNTVLYAL